MVLGATRIWCDALVKLRGQLEDRTKSWKQLKEAIGAINRAFIVKCFPKETIPARTDLCEEGDEFNVSAMSLFCQLLLHGIELAADAYGGIVTDEDRGANGAGWLVQIVRAVIRHMAFETNDNAFVTAILSETMCDTFVIVSETIWKTLTENPLYWIPKDVWVMIGKMIAPVDAIDRMKRARLDFRDWIPDERSSIHFVDPFGPVKDRLDVFFRQLEGILRLVQWLENDRPNVYRPLSPNDRGGMGVVSRFAMVTNMLHRLQYSSAKIAGAITLLSSFPSAVKFARGLFLKQSADGQEPETSFPTDDLADPDGPLMFILQCVRQMINIARLGPAVTLMPRSHVFYHPDVHFPVLRVTSSSLPGVTVDPSLYILQLYHILPLRDADSYLNEIDRLFQIHRAFYTKDTTSERSADYLVTCDQVKEWMDAHCK